MSNLKPEEEVARLMQLAEDVMKRATSRGAEVAEVRARSGSELTVKVRMGETEILEEAAHRSIGMRVMKQKRVALTSTSDLSPEGLERFIADALELVDISQEDAFAGPADDEAIMKGPPQDLDLYDERTGDVTAAQALIIAKRGETAARDADSRISNSDGATYSRSYGCFAMALSAGFRGGYAGSMSSLSVVPVAEDAGGKKRRGFYYTAKRFREDLEDAEAVGKQAAKRTIRKLGARKVNTQEAPVIFDPDAAQTLGAGVEIDAVHRSRDGGASWQRLDQGLLSGDIHGIAVVRDGARRTLFAATNKGLHRSHDEGETWAFQALEAPWQYTRSIVARADGDQTLFLTNGNGPPGSTGRLLRSLDRGASWQDAGLPGEINSTPWCVVSHPADPMLVFTVTNLGQLFRSRDGGLSWHKLRREFGEVRSMALLPA